MNDYNKIYFYERDMKEVAYYTIENGDLNTITIEDDYQVETGDFIKISNGIYRVIGTKRLAAEQGTTKCYLRRVDSNPIVRTYDELIEWLVVNGWQLDYQGGNYFVFTHPKYTAYTSLPKRLETDDDLIDFQRALRVITDVLFTEIVDGDIHEGGR